MADSTLWRIKTHLQFTGWLQYIPNLFFLGIFFLASLGWLSLGQDMFLFWMPAIVTLVLLLNLVFDICTVKLGFQPFDLIPSRNDDLRPFDLMRLRHSCRSFQSRNLTSSDLKELIDCAQFHTQPSQLIGNLPVRLEYIAAPLTVWPTVGAHEFFVAIAPAVYDRLAVIDVGRSLQKVVIHATRMGVATCWIGPGADHKSVIKNLGDRFDPEKDNIICVCALGYESRYLPVTIRLIQWFQHDRLPISSLFFADPQFRNPLNIISDPFSRFGRCYEVCQWSPSSFNAQPTRCAAITRKSEETEESLERFDFCASTNSRFYAPVALGIWCANWEIGCQFLDIKGHFAVLNPQERGVQTPPELPRYDVSWIIESFKMSEEKIKQNDDTSNGQKFKFD